MTKQYRDVVDGGEVMTDKTLLDEQITGRPATAKQESCACAQGTPAYDDPCPVNKCSPYPSASAAPTNSVPAGSSAVAPEGMPSEPESLWFWRGATRGSEMRELAEYADKLVAFAQAQYKRAEAIQANANEEREILLDQAEQERAKRETAERQLEEVKKDAEGEVMHKSIIAFVILAPFIAAILVGLILGI